jgi:hypothetical protein
MRNETSREGGWMLVEVMIAVTVLSVGVLGFMFSFQSNFKATRDIVTRDRAQAALMSAAEILRAANFSTLYAMYEGAAYTAGGLTSPDGGQAAVRVHFDVNETAMPAEYGPIHDIDGDGAMVTANASTSYVLLPTRLTLSYQAAYGPETRTLYMVLAH